MPRQFGPPDTTLGALVCAAADGTLEKLFRDALLALDDDAGKAFKATVAEAHRAGEIDLVATASEATGPVDHFAGMVYETAIIELGFDTATVVDLAKALARRSDDESLPYFMFDAVATWAALNERRVAGMVEAIGAGAAPACLRVATLQAGLRADRAKYLPLVAAMITTGDAAEANAAAFVVGTVSVADAAEKSMVSDAIATALTGNDPGRREAAFEAALAIGFREGGDSADAISAFDAVAGHETSHLRRIAANRLFMAKGEVPDVLGQRVLAMLGQVEEGEAETVEAINMAVAQRLKGEAGAPYRALLSDILARGVGDIEAMDDCAHQILTANDRSLEMLIADWVADGSDGLIDAVRDISRIPASNKEITFQLDFTGYGLTAGQTIASARKVASRLMLEPETSTSIILSLLRTGHPDAGDDLEALLFNPILISYWEGPKDFLTRAAPAQPPLVQERISRLVSALHNYEEAVRGVGVISELGPIARQSFLRQLYRAEEQRKVRDGMPRRPGLMDLFPVTRVLHGDSVVSEVHTGNGPPLRQEFRMGTVSHSVPLARMDAIDPIGFWYQRIVLSMGKRP